VFQIGSPTSTNFLGFFLLPIYFPCARKQILGLLKFENCWRVGPSRQWPCRRMPRPHWLSWVVFPIATHAGLKLQFWPALSKPLRPNNSCPDTTSPQSSRCLRERHRRPILHLSWALLPQRFPPLRKSCCADWSCVGRCRSPLWGRPKQRMPPSSFGHRHRGIEVAIGAIDEAAVKSRCRATDRVPRVSSGRRACQPP
jgi:hypothetical protein